MSTTETRVVTSEQLPLRLRELKNWPTLADFVAGQERQYVDRVLHACRGDKAVAAKVLGVDRLEARIEPISLAAELGGRNVRRSPRAPKMPKRTDLESILIIGAGPIVIGQACEFDYSGTQACKALKEEGFRVILVNSNPATIMTDPEFADVTYIEPLTAAILEKIIAEERPSALLPTLGGQTALNLSMELHKLGILAKYGVEMIGAKPEAIAKGEDRELFKQAMVKIGLDVAKSRTVARPEEARAAAERDRALSPDHPAVFTLGGQRGRHRLQQGGVRPDRRPTGSTSRLSTRCWSRSASSAGRSSRWRSCATTRTSAS